jgi:hypothetical protein
MLQSLPAQPPKAHTSHPHWIPKKATGFDIISPRDSNDSKTRKRLRASHNILTDPTVVPDIPKPPGPPRETIFDYFQQEAEKKDGASCVFLLWGSENSEQCTTWAVDVPTTDLEDEKDIFVSLKKRYDKERGFLRYFSLRKFIRLKPATVHNPPSHDVSIIYTKLRNSSS